MNLGGATAPITWATAGTGVNARTLILGATNATHKVTLQNPLDLGTATRTVQVDDGAAVVDGELSGALSGASAGLTKTGTGTLALTGPNTYTGPTTITGTLRIGGAGNLGGGNYAAGITINSSSALQYSSSADQTCSGAISGAGSLVKDTSSSTLILSGTQTYTGPTTVSAGTLTLSGMLSNTTASVTVAGGATLNVSAKGVTPAIASPGDLTLDACTLGFTGLSSPTVAPVNVSNVVVNGTVTINISGGLTIGQLPLIKYGTSRSGAGSFVIGLLPVGVTATLVTNVPNQSLDLDVTGAPVSIITDLPTTTTYRFAGGSYSQSVVAGGTPPLTYSWTRNGAPVGGNSPTLNVTGLTLGDSGGYSVRVSNATTSAQSSTNQLVVMTPSVYDSLVLASGPLALWPLNESSGPTAFDFSAGYSGAYSVSGVTYSVPGPTNNAVVTMDGVNGVVTIPYASALNPAAFSFELLVNPSQVPKTVAYIASSVQMSGHRSGWYLAQDDGATFGEGSAFVVRLFNLNGSTNSTQLAAPVSAPGWYHLVLTYDGTTASLYQNGVLVTNALAAFVPNVSAPLTVGERSDGALNWPGSVGGVALFNRALTSTEVAQHSLNPPLVLNYTWFGGVLTLDWTSGTLLSAPEVTGTYTNVLGAVSPYLVPLTQPRKFFRVGN